jgi:hypothetical protein
LYDLARSSFLHDHGLSSPLNFRCNWCLFPCNKMTQAAYVAQEALHPIAQLCAVSQQASGGVAAEVAALRESSG